MYKRCRQTSTGPGKYRLTGKCERVHKTTCIRDEIRLPLVRENIE